MHYLNKLYTFGVRTYRITIFLIVELYYAIRYVIQEAIKAVKFCWKWRTATLFTAVLIAIYWPLVSTTAIIVAERYNIPRVTFASEVAKSEAEIIVIQEGRFEEILAEEEAKIRADKEPEIKQQALNKAKEIFDDEVLKLQLGLPLE